MDEAASQVASILQQRILEGHASAESCPPAQPVGLTDSLSRDQSNAGPALTVPSDTPEPTSPLQTSLHPDAAEHTSTSDSSEAQPEADSDEDHLASQDHSSNSDAGPASDGGSDTEDASSHNPSSKANGDSAVTGARLTVTCCTADFAMQNVLLQMGLQLQAPNGLQIKRVSRSVQRCSACFFIVKVI